MIYVLGFVFDRGWHNVLLVCKTRPDWQAGRLNGLGGKVREDEGPAAAMARELAEETGGLLGEVELAPYGRLRGRDGEGRDFEVWLYWGRYRSKFPIRLQGRDSGEGSLQIVRRTELSLWPVLSNLLYLVPMANAHARGFDQASFFEIVETNVPGEAT